MAAALAVTALALTGCTPIVAMTPADDAKNIGCAEIVVRLPELVAGLEQRKTDAQGTGAWGEPTGVLLWCGVPVPDPTATLTCYTIDGVDWLVDPKDDPRFVFTTYGRDPAISVAVDNELAGGRAALTDLAGVVKLIPADRACVDPEDTLGE